MTMTTITNTTTTTTTTTIFDDNEPVSVVVEAPQFNYKQKGIAIAPKTTALLSMIGSGCILYHVLCTWIQQQQKQQRKPNNRHSSGNGSGDGHTYLRLMFMMSLFDFIVSFTFFFTTWPIPMEHGDVVYGAVGNMTTCTIQGFFSQFSIVVALYNAMLSLYYVLKIRYGYTTNRITNVVEPIMHLIPLSIGLGTSFAAIQLELYNNDSWECWIAPLPQDCKESWKISNNDEEVSNCIRGDNASLYRWVFYYAILWTAIVAVIINMFLVYSYVRSLEKANAKYGEHSIVTSKNRYNNNSQKNDDQFEDDDDNEQSRAVVNKTKKSKQKQKQNKNNNYSKQVAIQGYWYCGAFLATWILPTITRLTQLWGVTPYPLILATAMFVPIQGFFNCIVYFYPRWQREKKLKAKKKKASQAAKASSSKNVTTTNNYNITSFRSNNTNNNYQYSTEGRGGGGGAGTTSQVSCRKDNENSYCDEPLTIQTQTSNQSSLGSGSGSGETSPDNDTTYNCRMGEF